MLQWGGSTQGHAVYLFKHLTDKYVPTAAMRNSALLYNASNPREGSRRIPHELDAGHLELRKLVTHPDTPFLDLSRDPLNKEFYGLLRTAMPEYDTDMTYPVYRRSGMRSFRLVWGGGFDERKKAFKELSKQTLCVECNNFKSRTKDMDKWNRNKMKYPHPMCNKCIADKPPPAKARAPKMKPKADIPCKYCQEPVPGTANKRTRQVQCNPLCEKAKKKRG
jgi:hypothetical protein